MDLFHLQKKYGEIHFKERVGDGCTGACVEVKYKKPPPLVLSGGKKGIHLMK